MKRLALFAAALLTILGSVVTLAMPASASTDSDEWDFLARLNQARTSRGLATVAMLPALRDAARVHSARMATQNMLFHNPELAAVATATAPDWTRAAENVGRGMDVASIDKAFIDSPGHYANIVGGYNYVGIGVVYSAGLTYVTLDFVNAAPGKPVASAPALSVDVTRVGGSAESDTTLAVSRRYPAGSANAVVVGRNDLFADALAGGPLAAANDGPLLLSAPGAVSPGLVDEARRVLRQGGTVYLLGGPAALSDSVAQAFEGAGLDVERVFGDDRYDTAREVAHLLGSEPSEVLLVSGTNFADAMVAGPVGARRHAPILLTSPTGVPAATAEFLRSVPRARRTVIGGPVAVSDAVFASADADERIAGGDRYDTSVRVAERWWGEVTQVSLATGATFQDALAGAAYSALTGMPLVLVSSDPTSAVRAYLSSLAAGLTATIVYGTVSAVSDATLLRLFG